jgi:hypothetical protein
MRRSRYFKDIQTAPQPLPSMGHQPLFVTLRTTILFSADTPQASKWTQH